MAEVVVRGREDWRRITFISRGLLMRMRWFGGWIILKACFCSGGGILGCAEFLRVIVRRFRAGVVGIFGCQGVTAGRGSAARIVGRKVRQLLRWLVCLTGDEERERPILRGVMGL